MPTPNLLPDYDTLYKEYLEFDCNTKPIAEKYKVIVRSVERKLKRGSDIVGYEWPTERTLSEEKAKQKLFLAQTINPLLLRMEVKEFCFVYAYGLDDLSAQAKVPLDLLLNLHYDAEVEVTRKESYQIIRAIMRLEEELKPKREWVLDGTSV